MKKQHEPVRQQKIAKCELPTELYLISSQRCSADAKNINYHTDETVLTQEVISCINPCHDWEISNLNNKYKNIETGSSAKK